MPLTEGANTPEASQSGIQPSSDASASPQGTAPRRQPPPETPESLWVRRSVVLSFWLVVLLLGLPVWWKTTAIYRADLPLQHMTDWADGKVSVAKRNT